MEDAEPPSMPERPNGYPPAQVGARLVARLIDGLAVSAPFVLLDPLRRPVIAALTAAALVLCADRLFGPGRSLGKRLTGLRVLVLRTRLPGGITASMRRNALFAVAILPAAAGTPASLAWACAALAAVAVLEACVAFSPLTRDLGRRRTGDLLAGTQVIDASIPLGLSIPVATSRARAAATVSAAPRHAARANTPISARRNPPEEPACASP